MPPDRYLTDAIPLEPPSHQDLQQLIEAESGKGTQGIRRAWQASDSDKLVLTSDSTGVKISRDAGVTPPTQVIVDGTPAGGGLAGTYPNPTLGPVTLDELAASTIDALIPPASIWAYAGGVPPGGWLLCNGQSVSTATYPKLFAVIGYAYGGSGGNFNVPNLQGRVVLGVSGTHALTTTGGAESVLGPPHTHTGNHNHTLNNHQHDLANSHTHSLNNHQHDLEGSHSHGQNAHTHTTQTHAHTLLNSHTHGMTNHDHTLNSHTHGAAALGVGGSTGSSSSTNGLYVAGGATATTVGHTHDNGTLDVTGTTDAAPGSTSGATNYTDGGAGLTGNANTGSTGNPTPPGSSGGPSNPNTEGAPAGTQTAISGTTATGNAALGTQTAISGTTNTGDSSSAPAAVYSPTTLATMPPFISLSYIIRTGV